jgi:cytochrome b561
MPAQIRTRGFRYDPVTIALHWLVAAVVIFQWAGGRTIDWFPKGPLKIDARSAHLVAGLLLALVVVFRLYWKALRGERAPRSPDERFGAIARVAHWLLLVLVICLCGLGLLLEGLRGDSLFNVVRLPALGAFDPAARHLLANRITDWHGLAANLILVLAGLHASAAMVHHFALKDGVLRRML